MIVGHLNDGSILIGLSEANLIQLLEGHPATVDHKKQPGCLPKEIPKIIIVTGKTEEDMVRSLRREGFLTAATEIHKEQG